MQPDSALQFFAKFIETELGIIYADHNSFQLRMRLEDIARLMGVPGIPELHKMAQDGIWGQFKQLLLDTATNNETSFFRDPRVFHAMEAYLAEQGEVARAQGRPVRIWSAASSTGQEPLSLAITALECSRRGMSSAPFSILATDVCDKVLSRAKNAEYSQLEVQRGLPAAMMVKYFRQETADRWRAGPELMRHIEFKKQNLKEAFSFPGPFDIVFCRNVLIYQAPPSKKAILAKITDTLSDGGCLVLGSGESLIGLSSDYEAESQHGAIVYRKKKGAAKAA